ncbi:hypothetical protein ACTXT7_012731 [Hymenolepis weldensis]
MIPITNEPSSETPTSNFTISVNGTTLSEISQDDNVFSTIISVFLTQYIFIILGFFVGHFKLLSKAQTRGLGRFVYRYALSAILFMDFTSTYSDYLRRPMSNNFFPRRKLHQKTMQPLSASTCFFVNCVVINDKGILGTLKPLLKTTRGKL